MGALAVSALVVFVALILYYRLQRHRPISTDADDVAHFVSLKKAVCLGLLLAFVVTGALVADPSPQSPPRRRHRPLRPSSSVGLRLQSARPSKERSVEGRRRKGAGKLAPRPRFAAAATTHLATCSSRAVRYDRE
ncbi:hypothetical protein OAF85_00165 [Planctomycetota bacterium]|nr:hypothetical protein [Planctomycetota bacterium]